MAAVVVALRASVCELRTKIGIRQHDPVCIVQSACCMRVEYRCSALILATAHKRTRKNGGYIVIKSNQQWRHSEQRQRQQTHKQTHRD